MESVKPIPCPFLRFTLVSTSTVSQVFHLSFQIKFLYTLYKLVKLYCWTSTITCNYGKYIMIKLLLLLCTPFSNCSPYCFRFAAFYFMISKAEDFEGSWGYPKPIGAFASVTRKYLKSLYWSTLTLTTIGDLPPPEKNWE